MSCVRSIPKSRITVVVTSTTAVFFPCTDYSPVTTMSAANFLVNLVSIDGPGEYKPGVQLATVRTDKPSAGLAITSGAYTQATGFTQFRESIGAANSGFLRFGQMVRLQAGQSGQAVLTFETNIDVDDCGAVLGAQHLDAQPNLLTGTTDADTAIVAITNWHSTLRVNKLKGLAVVQDNQNTALEYAFFVRSTNDKLAPAAWINLEAGVTNPAAGNTERNTGELSVPAGANFSTRSFYQIGLGMRRKSGASGNPRASLHVMAHAKFA